MKNPEHHIFVCASFRVTGDPQGVCNKKGSVPLLQYLEGEISDRGLTGIAVSSTGCMKLCEKGPVMVVYPENWWYGGVDSESVIDEILDSLESGTVCSSYIVP